MINAQTLIGTVLGTVSLQKVIGQGESGVVFLAQQSPTAPQVAVRILSPAAIQTPGQGAAFLERFHKEINVVSSLQHPNILPVLAYSKHDGMAYMVMPYVSGETLQSMIERQGQLPLSLVANYLDQLANALDYAHKQGILHLNLKPGNVFLTNGERLLLSDFGLTKMDIERQASHMRLLRAGRPVGSLDYMAPEQIMGDVVDARTDLYSLGVMLYQVVTGKTPFQIGTPQQIASQVLQAPPPSPHLLRNDLPRAAEQVILQALAKRPLDRHANRSLNTAVLEDPSSLAIPSQKQPRHRHKDERHKLLDGYLHVIVVASVLRIQQSRQRRTCRDECLRQNARANPPRSGERAADRLFPEPVSLAPRVLSDKHGCSPYHRFRLR